MAKWFFILDLDMKIEMENNLHINEWSGVLNRLINRVEYITSRAAR